MSALLVANIGNSRVALGLFVLPIAGHVPEPADVAAFPVPVGDSFSPGFQPSLTIEAAVLASVNPRCDRPVANWIQTALGVRPLRFPHEVPPPMGNRYEPASSVGADRLANAVAASQEFRCPCVVVDTGTAVTVDALATDGTFLGGAILPGLDLQARSLALGTALLPELHLAEPGDLAEPGPAIGPSTAAGISSGVLRGLAGAIDRLVEDISHELGGTPRLVITGGDAARLASLCRAQFAVRPHLGLVGLALAYAHAARQRTG